MDFITNNVGLSVLVGIFVGGAAGYLGSLMILKRMALVGDALSHVALPGMGLALLWHVNPFIGAFVALILGISAIWLVETKTKLPTEALVGVVFTVSLAVGVLLTPEPELIEALFGDITKVTPFDLLLAAVLSIIVLFVAKRIMAKMVLATLSEDLAKANGVAVDKMNFIYLLLVATIVALGIKVVGTLLMGALVIIPAAASKNVHTTLRGYSYTAFIFGLLSMVIGILIGLFFDLAPGPSAVLVSTVFFVFSIVIRKSR